MRRVCVSVLVALAAFALVASPVDAGRDFARLSVDIQQQLNQQQRVTVPTTVVYDDAPQQQPLRELTDDEKHALLSAKMRPAVRYDDMIAAFLEEENRFEDSMWLLHLNKESNMRCVGEVFQTCRKHRDWCRQQCDLHDPDSEQRCHRLKCDTLLETCHHHHFDACDSGQERGVSDSWRDVMDSRTFCVKKIESQCADHRAACLSSCEKHSDKCQPSACDQFHLECQQRHRNSCQDPRLGRPASAASRSSTSSSFSESSGRSESTRSLPDIDVPNKLRKPEPFVKPAGEPLTDSGKIFETMGQSPSGGCTLGSACPSGSSSVDLKYHPSLSSIAANGYIRCEKQLAVQCEAAEKACLRKCHVQSLDGDFPKCNPEECWSVAQKCSNADLHCDMKDERITADEMKPHEKLCTPEDTGCNHVSPDIIERIECDASNNYCSKEQVSPPSSCPTCEVKRHKCLEECKREPAKIITFSSGPIPQPKPCSPRRCYEEAEICAVDKCHPEVAKPKIEPDEIPEGSTRLRLLHEAKAREESEKEAALQDVKERAAFCGNGRVDPGEDCDGGFGCKLKQCKCGDQAKPFNPPQIGCDGGPAPCSYARSGCMFGSQQVVPKIVPRGALFNLHTGN